MANGGATQSWLKKKKKREREKRADAVGTKKVEDYNITASISILLLSIPAIEDSMSVWL